MNYNILYALVLLFSTVYSTNLAGCRKIGEINRSHGHLIKNIAIQSLKKKPTISIYGNDYKTKDGTCIRDYIHVSDIANAHILALKYAVDQGKLENLEFYNLGSGNGVSILEVISTFENLSNLKLNYNLSARRAGDVESIYSNSKKAKSKLGWKTKFELTEMMSSAWNWQQQLEKEKNEQS